MDNERIKGLNDLIKKFNGDHLEIVDKKVSNLTLPGENYWSDMLRLELTIENKETGTKSVEHFVGKCVLQVDDGRNTGDLNLNVFRSEILFYREILPTLQQFLRDHGLPESNIFPKMIAARLNLADEGVVDENAVLILENLYQKGYETTDRLVGFDLDGAKLLLADLATFHAIPMAIKIKDPQLFKEKIVDNCVLEAPKIPTDGEAPRRSPFPIELLRRLVEEDPFGKDHLSKWDNFIAEAKEKLDKLQFFLNKDHNLTFTTLIHNDMWINNTMQMTDEAGKPIKNKFLDFQIGSISVPSSDLVFFLITSVNLATLEEHFDYLLKYYHEHFIRTLELFECDVSPFQYDKFMRQMKEGATDKFMQATMMNMMVINAEKGVKLNFNKDKKLEVTDIHPVARNKMLLLFREMVQREWI